MLFCVDSGLAQNPPEMPQVAFGDGHWSSDQMVKWVSPIEIQFMVQAQAFPKPRHEQPRLQLLSAALLWCKKNADAGGARQKVTVCLELPTVMARNSSFKSVSHPIE